MRAFLLLCLLWAGAVTARAGEFTVLVYNVEHLTAADGHTQSPEYLATRYSRRHLLNKMVNIAKVVAQFGEGRGPDVILFQEIERDFKQDQYLFDHAGMLRHFSGTTIEEMLDRGKDRAVDIIPVEGLLLKTFEDRGLKGYRVVAGDDAADRKERRHVTHLNVVFSRFPLREVRTHMLPGMPATLEVQLAAAGAPLYVFNNHWKGDAISEKDERGRIAAARIVRSRLDDILSVNPNADIIVAGDFNCFHNHRARMRYRETALGVLGSQGSELSLRGEEDLYNLWFELPEKEWGSEVYHNVWGTFMQMMVSRGLYDFRGVQYVDDSFGVGEFPGLNTTEEGRPWRWSNAGFGSGFSEHFPVYARFTTVRNNRADQYLTLPTKPREERAEGRKEPKEGKK